MLKPILLTISLYDFNIHVVYFKHWWSTISTISSKRKSTCHLNFLHIRPRHMTLEIQVLAWNSPFLPKITKKSLVGLMTFWLGLIKNLSYKDLWYSYFYKEYNV